MASGFASPKPGMGPKEASRDRDYGSRRHGRTVRDDMRNRETTSDTSREGWDSRLLASHELRVRWLESGDASLFLGAARDHLRFLNDLPRAGIEDSEVRSRAMALLANVGPVLAVLGLLDELDRFDESVCILGDHRHENSMAFSLLHYQILQEIVGTSDREGVIQAIRMVARRARAAELAHRWHAVADLGYRAIEALVRSQAWYEVSRVLVYLKTTPEIFLHESTGTLAKTLAVWSCEAFRVGALEEGQRARRELVEFHELWPVPAVLAAYLSVLEVVIQLSATGVVPREEGRRALSIVSSIQTVKAGEESSLAVLKSCQDAARVILEPGSRELQNLEATLVQ